MKKKSREFAEDVIKRLRIKNPQADFYFEEIDNQDGRRKYLMFNNSDFPYENNSLCKEIRFRNRNREYVFVGTILLESATVDNIIVAFCKHNAEWPYFIRGELNIEKSGNLYTIRKLIGEGVIPKKEKNEINEDEMLEYVSDEINSWLTREEN